MGNLFGRKKQSRVTEQDKAILVSGGGARAQPVGARPRAGGRRSANPARSAPAGRGLPARR